jgi:hypothetical protein
MFLVTAKRGRLQWVSGVFQHRQDAESYLAEIPEELRSVQRAQAFQVSGYPLYMSEKEAGFHVMSGTDAESLLGALQRKSDDEWCYLNLYKLREDWRPDQPGTDQMGSLAHVHIENWHLDRFAESGLKAFF